MEQLCPQRPVGLEAEAADLDRCAMAALCGSDLAVCDVDAIRVTATLDAVCKPALAARAMLARSQGAKARAARMRSKAARQRIDL